MARDRSPIVKMSRREGYALHPKAHKALAKKAEKPMQRGQGRRPAKASQYSLQLREKQKVKRLYGLLERQFSNAMREASRTQGQSGQVLLQNLERRLDNAIYRAGFAASRPAARQLVTHGHFMLNDRRVDIPSILVTPGDKIKMREKSLKGNYFKLIDDISPDTKITYSWMSTNRKKGEVTISGLPTRDEAEPDINEQLIVEYYSR